MDEWGHEVTENPTFEHRHVDLTGKDCGFAQPVQNRYLDCLVILYSQIILNQCLNYSRSRIKANYQTEKKEWA